MSLKIIALSSDFKEKLSLLSNEADPQIVSLKIDDVSDRHGHFETLYQWQFSTKDVTNVDYKEFDNELISMTLKINKFCKGLHKKPAKFKQSLFRSNSWHDNKENICPNNIEVVEFKIDAQNESIRINSRRSEAVNDEDYQIEEIEEGPRFSKSKEKKRSSSVISKKTPRNSSMKQSSSKPPRIIVNSLINKRIQGLDKIFRPPSTQRVRRNCYSSFNLKSCTNAKVVSIANGYNKIPKPDRYSFKCSETKSQMIDSSNITYNEPKSEVDHSNYMLNLSLSNNAKLQNTTNNSLYNSDERFKVQIEELKDELSNRNITILNLQKDMKQIKAEYEKEKLNFAQILQQKELFITQQKQEIEQFNEIMSRKIIENDESKEEISKAVETCKKHIIDIKCCKFLLLVLFLAITNNKTTKI